MVIKGTYDDKGKGIKNVGISLTLPVQTEPPQPPQPPQPPKPTTIGNSIQIMFSKTVLSDSDITNIKSITKNIKNIFVHASYQINIASPFILTNDKKKLYNPALEILKKEINYTKKIGGKGIIVHMGKNAGLKYDNDVVNDNSY